MRKVPPDTGFAELVDGADADDGDDDELHAASPAPATRTAAIPVTRLALLVTGMFFASQ
jgi:hypothetical protein